MIWLTNGHRWLGPYLSEELTAIMRGQRTLADDPYGPSVWRVTAPTRHTAQQAFDRSVKR